jgi:hypothetical protein
MPRSTPAALVLAVVPAVLVACASGRPADPAGAPGSAQRAEAAEPATDPLGAALDAYLERTVPFGFSGVFLVARGGEVILEGGYGLADREAGTPDHAGDGVRHRLDHQAVHRRGDPEAGGRGAPEHGRPDRPLAPGRSGGQGGDHDPPPAHPLVRPDRRPRRRLPGDAARHARPAGARVGAGGRAGRAVRLLQPRLQPARRDRRDRLRAAVRALSCTTGCSVPRGWSRPATWSPPGRRSAWPSATAAASAGARRWTMPGPTTGRGGTCAPTAASSPPSRDLHRWHRALEDDRVLSAGARRKMTEPHVSEGFGDSHYGYGWAVSTTPRGTRGWSRTTAATATSSRTSSATSTRT